ncbi:Protein ELC [Tetrabaena socialis]|uniref:Protein ELC n=1 Tax=Tetrabaena socialis TaxID=47790 RepID=A0A2J8AFR8_9CHLO|nr:Protein ELC [Tetrabaena socialis]|eukprot:PNH11346.1 Protein ELC [Tetrabaena socialis]
MPPHACAEARDLAAEDAILALDRLLQTGQVPLDAYLKQVRALCRKQFFSRALGLKVAVAQQVAAAHPPPAAGGPGSFRTQAYPIAHGDSWSHGVPPPPPQQQQQQAAWQPQQPGPGSGLGGPPALHTGLLVNPLAGHGR